MLFAAGWCVLRSSRAAYATATRAEIDAIDAVVDEADAELWAAFREWMRANETPWLLWSLFEHHNNHNGLLQVYVSRNHRTSPFWAMLEWIAANGPGSYGLFYIHDDEDGRDDSRPGQPARTYYDNVFRVQRVLDGRVEELADPFFGPIVPNIEPPSPCGRDSPGDEA